MSGQRLLTSFIGLVFLAMAVALIFLAKQNHDLKAALPQLQEELGAARNAAASLKAGEVLEPLELPTLAGEVRRLAYDDPSTDTILLIFSPECPACRDNFDNWKKVEAAHDPRRGGLFYVSTAEPEKTVDFAKNHSLPDPVLLSDPSALAKYKVDEIPMTILVGPGGVVKKVWVGTLSRDALEQLGVTRS